MKYKYLIVTFIFTVSFFINPNLFSQERSVKRVSEDINKEINFSNYIPSYPLFSLKTNIIPWIATVGNLGTEIKLNPHISLDLSLWWCPWKISDKYSLKTFAILPEGRWWISNDWRGHFLGLHLTAAWFNLRYNSDRYQDNKRPILGAGFSYGYYFEFNKNWGLELMIGAGYLNMSYDRFYNIRYYGIFYDTYIKKIKSRTKN